MSTSARRARFVLPAVFFAALLAVGTVVPARSAAAADTPVTWYVNNTRSCSDAAPASGNQTFCSIAAGLAQASPGDTVRIVGNHAEDVVVTKSGEPGRPITLGWDGTTRFGVNTLTVTGAHDVVVQGAYVRPPAGADGLTIADSSAITVDTVTAVAPTGAAGDATGMRLRAVRDSTLRFVQANGAFRMGVSLDAQTAGVTIRRPVGVGTGTRAGAAWIEIAGDHNTLIGANVGGVQASTVRVTAEATGTVITRNILRPGGGGIVSDAGQDTRIVGNTISGYCAGISIDAQSRGAIVENNVLSPATSTSCTGIGIAVDAAATSTTTVDYNSIGARPYAWGAATYASVADFQAATGQGAHDLPIEPGQAAPARDNADSAAPGWTAADQYDRLPEDDPATPNEGSGPVTYADRGANETVRTPTVTLDTSLAEGGLTVRVEAVPDGAPWSPIVSYAFDFDDGARIVQSGGQATHTYAGPGGFRVSVTVTDQAGATYRVERIVHTGTSYTPLPPQRLLDTRTGGSAADASGHVRTLALPTALQAPNTAVVLNVTVPAAHGAGFLTAYGYASARPDVSNLNWVRGQTVANTVTVPVIDGRVQFYSSSPGEDLVVDIVGYYATNPGLLFHPAGPQRALDSRDRAGASGGQPLVAGTTTVVGLPSAPAAECRAAAVNVTVTGGTGPGFLTLFDSTGTPPATSTINWSAGQTISNMTVAPATAGRVAVHVGGRFAVHVILDVAGWFCPDSVQHGSAFHPAFPARALDTRNQVGIATTTPVRAGGTVTLSAQGFGGLPGDATAAVLNVTVTQPKQSGFVTAYQYGAVRPNASSVNYAAGQTVPNLVIVPVTDGRATLYTLREAHLIADVFGYYAK